MKQHAIEELAHLLGSVVRHSSPREVTIACPFAPYGGHKHSVDQNPNFGIKVDDDARSVCNCFSCGRKGLLIRVMNDLVELDPKFTNARDFVKENENGIFLPSRPLTKKIHKTDPTLVNVMRAVDKGTVSKKLKKTGITLQEIKHFGLAYDVMNDRDIFPVYDFEKRLRGIVGRKVNGELDTPYHNYGDAVELTKVFFGEQFLDLTHDTAILVEGPRDVIKVSRIYKNALGLCGNMVMPEARINKLKKWFDRITLMLDGDAAGKAGMFRLGLLLSKLFVVEVALLPEGMDPWDCSPDQIKQAYENRKLWSLVSWKGGEATNKKKVRASL